MMKFKMSKETAVSWIESTVDEIKSLLEQRRIPYEDSWTKNENMLLSGVFYLHQIKFPWHEGDVVIGTLHAQDDDVINGLVSLRYPSIESYGFPWDNGDVTVFDIPERFVYELNRLYEKTVATKTLQ